MGAGRKLILPLILGLSQMSKGIFLDRKGEDFTVPVDTKGMMARAKKNRDQKYTPSKRELKRTKGKKNRRNRGRQR